MTKPQLASFLRSNWSIVAGFVVLMTVAIDTGRIRRENHELLSLLTARSAVLWAADAVRDAARTLVSGDHSTTLLSPRSTGSLLVQLSYLCPYSQRNFEAWHRLAAEARAQGWQVVWITRDKLRQIPKDAARREIAGGLIADPTYATYVQLKLATVPQTVLVRKDGVVQSVYAGILDAESETNLRIELQGVSANRSSKRQ